MEEYLKERLKFLENNCVDIFMNITPSKGESENNKKNAVRRMVLRLFTTSEPLEEDENYELYQSYLLDGFIVPETIAEDFDDMSRSLFIEGVLSIISEEAIKCRLQKDEFKNFKAFITSANDMLEETRFHTPGMIKEKHAKIKS